MHRDVEVFVDHDNHWYVQWPTPCEALREDGRCGRYEERPPLCRDHGNEPESCEHAGTPYKLKFGAVEEFERWLESRGKDWRFRR